MKLVISTFIAGLLFGAGLTISQMVNPDKVVSFLDVAGNWDPSLAIVMASAFITTFIGYRFVLKRPAPFFEGKFKLPTREDIDMPLIGGAALFGIGWGLVGLCPGPALSSLSFAGLNSIIFLAAMLVAIISFRIIIRN